MKSPRTVFVVDDDVHVLDSVKCLLQCVGHDVTCYSTAKQFLDQVSPEQTGCLITDLSMPEIDGFELQTRLRDMKSLLSVIIVTGRADIGSTVRLMRNGAVTLLEKPYQAEKLIEAVDDSLTQSETRAGKYRSRMAARRQLALLDEDERDVISLAAEGLPNKAISHRLALSARTVDRRRQSAMLKLSISSPAGYTRLVSQAGDDDDGDGPAL